MYERLIMEMKKHGITQKKLAEAIGVTEASAGTKVRGKSRFNSDEMFIICEMIPEVPMHELFKKD